MCKSHQHQSSPNIFNLTITRKIKRYFVYLKNKANFILASMKIYPNDGIIELNRHQHSINLSCSVRELPTNIIDPLKLKWFHNNQEINHQRNSHLINKYPHHNQATLILYIHHLSLNDTGLFKCVYDNRLISKDVQIFYTSAGISNDLFDIFI